MMIIKHTTFCNQLCCHGNHNNKTKQILLPNSISNSIENNKEFRECHVIYVIESKHELVPFMPGTIKKYFYKITCI